MAAGTSMKIGIGITTTPSRHNLIGKAIDMHHRHIPSVEYELYWHNDHDMRGVAHCKNLCLANLDTCDHIFLFDDDCYPIAMDWWKPYVEHPQPHLMYQFPLPGKPLKELYRDEYTVSYDRTRGAMIYIERDVLDFVGGFDTRFLKGGFEHPNFTDRIHNAGLTTHRAMDVPNSHKLLYCLDQDQKVESSIKLDYKTKRDNYKLYTASRNSKEYMEYK